MMQLSATRIRLLLSTVGLLWTVVSMAQSSAPAWQVAISPGGTTPPLIRSVAADSADNVYLTGSFYGTATFGEHTLTSRGAEDVFVAKWNRTTNRFLWAQRAGGTERDIAVQLAIRGSSIYLTGSCQSHSYDFGGLALRNTSLTGNMQAYVAKLMDEGTSSRFSWVQPIGTGQAGGSALAVQGASVFVTGSYYGPLVFPGVTLRNASGPNLGTTDLYVVKLLDAGPSARLAWAQRAGGALGEGARAVAVAGNNVYVAGTFDSPVAYFGSTQLVNVKPGAGTTDAFVAKLTDEGTHGSFVWARQAGGWFHDCFNALAVRGSSVYVAGFFGTTVTLGPAGVARNAGTLDVVVAKLTDAGPTGEFTWVQTAGGCGYDEAQALVVQDNWIYVTGETSSTEAVFGKHTLQHELGANVFVTRLTDFGQASAFDWVQQAGGPGNSEVYALALSGKHIYVGGFMPSPGQLGNLTVRHEGNMFVAFLGSLTDAPAPVTSSATLALGLEVYPNPARSVLWVRVPPVPDAQSVTLTVLDAAGRVVQQQAAAVPASGQPESIDLTRIAPGMYLLRVQTKDLATSHRFVVE
ncbi:T9SS type A sorting domain-containing protein [Hymenobacter glacieicola]|uniref:Secretion system C-terminal sorting domain-containing protein n=1 Tax=Hymenobacter glacieicola TaxID=1562124 RepID=A0ABQ1WMV5_9BACT|nr:T9SS type A sorting domain-containing protein [Hymenobacter glacieicola]GGG37592.1 hypothetical protein GCM10011378_12380 [Hymenobacter glacieicola]